MACTLLCKGEKFGLPEGFSGLSAVPADLTPAAGLGSPAWAPPNDE